MTAMRQTPLTCSGHTRPVVQLSFSDVTSDGYYLISACKDGKPMLRKGDTGDWIGTFEGHKGAVWGVALDRKALRAATASADFEAKIWNSIDGTVLSSLPHKHIVKCVAFSSDDTKLVTGGNEKIIRVYDLNRLDEEPMKMDGHTSSIRQALFLNDDKCLITASDDHSIRLWDLESQEEVRKLVFPEIPNDIELSRDGRVLTVATSTKVILYDIDNLDTHSASRIYETPTKVYSASLAPDNSVFVCGGDDFQMYKYSFEDGKKLDSFKGHFGPVHSIRFSPDGELYASGSEDGTVRLWQTIVGKTYGLWKCESSNTSTKQSFPQPIGELEKV